MKNKVTVVIPTHERHHLLEKRVLPHYLPFEIPILIIDSSAKPHQPSIDDPRIDYVHCPGEPLPHKFKRPISDKVKTPYMFMSADDTIHSKDAVNQCIDFLEANPDFSTCSGIEFQCYQHDKKLVDTNNFDLFSLPVDSHRAEERVLQIFSRFDSIFYAVTRTECWKNTMKWMPQEIVNYYLSETYIVMMAVLHGKRRRLPIFYSATEAGPSINDQDPRYHCSPFKLATDSRYNPEVVAIKHAAIKYLMEQSAISHQRAEVYVEGGLALYWLQDKPVKSFKDRLRLEWQSFLNKTFYKKEYIRTKAIKKERLRKEREQYTQQAMELIGPAGREELDRLMSIIQQS